MRNRNDSLSCTYGLAVFTYRPLKVGKQETRKTWQRTLRNSIYRTRATPYRFHFESTGIRDYSRLTVPVERESKGEKKSRGQRGTTRVATAAVSTHTRIHRKERLPREGDTAPSPMRGSSATERVEAGSSSRKPQAASADRRRPTNQGCPLRNYPTPKN